MIWFDQDGVLAKFDLGASEEDLHRELYFYQREPELSAIGLLKKLYDDGYPVGIRGAAYREGTARRDKLCWCSLWGLSHIPFIFVDYGKSKADGLDGGRHLLIDDFTRNLREWEGAGYTGVKFYNGINGTHGTWDGYSIDHKMPVEKMAVIIKAAYNAAV